VARRPRESRAVMLDDIPDAQVAAQAAPDPGGSQRESAPRVPDARSCRSDPVPAASAAVAPRVSVTPSDVL
jgi:hypothetical protein